MFSEKKNIYSFTELFNGNYSIQGCFDIAVAEQDAPADLVGADLAVVHPVGERHERDAQTAGGFAPREIFCARQNGQHRADKGDGTVAIRRAGTPGSSSKVDRQSCRSDRFPLPWFIRFNVAKKIIYRGCLK